MSFNFKLKTNTTLLIYNYVLSFSKYIYRIILHLLIKQIKNDLYFTLFMHCVTKKKGMLYNSFIYLELMFAEDESNDHPKDSTSVKTGHTEAMARVWTTTRYVTTWLSRLDHRPNINLTIFLRSHWIGISFWGVHGSRKERKTRTFRNLCLLHHYITLLMTPTYVSWTVWTKHTYFHSTLTKIKLHQQGKTKWVSYICRM